MIQPVVQPMQNGTDWMLLEDFLHILPDERLIFIPKGFIFDFASIPRLAWRLFPPATGKHRTPALVHDWLCATAAVTWKESADIFLNAMCESGVSYLKRYAIYWSVRGYGLFHKADPQSYHWRSLQARRINKLNIQTDLVMVL